MSSAFGITQIVVKGTFNIPIDVERLIHALYVPYFKEYILKVSKLTRLFNLLFTRDEDTAMKDGLSYAQIYNDISSR